MAEKKPAPLTNDDWETILRFDRAAREAIDTADLERVNMLYSKVRYPMCALIEYTQRAYARGEE